MAAVAGGDNQSKHRGRDPLENVELQTILEQEREFALIGQPGISSSQSIGTLEVSADPIPVTEALNYRKIETCLRSFIRTSRMFQPAKAILHNAMLKAKYGFPVDLDALEHDLIRQGLYAIPTTQSGTLAVLSYAQDVTYGITSDEELKRLKESEIEDFLRDRLVIILKLNALKEPTYELCLDRPDLE